MSRCQGAEMTNWVTPVARQCQREHYRPGWHAMSRLFCLSLSLTSPLADGLARCGRHPIPAAASGGESGSSDKKNGGSWAKNKTGWRARRAGKRTASTASLARRAPPRQVRQPPPRPP